RLVVTRREHTEHERGATDAAQEGAPVHAEPPGRGVGLEARAPDRLLLHRAERYRPVLTVRARPELDRELELRIPRHRAPYARTVSSGSHRLSANRPA